VNGAPGTHAALARFAESVGIDDHERAAVVAAAVHPDDVGRHELAADLAHRLERPVVSGTVRGVHVLVTTAAPEELVAALGRLPGRPRAAVGTGVVGLANAGRTSREALEALAVRTSERVVGYDDVLSDLMLAREPGLAARLVEHVLGGLSDKLVETLRCHVEHDLDPRATAAVLGVHRNTVTYRLQRVQETSGLDLRRPRDLAQVVLALSAVPPRPPR
jgi:DNA-binding PucR family transcriptional regulator